MTTCRPYDDVVRALHYSVLLLLTKNKGKVFMCRHIKLTKVSLILLCLISQIEPSAEGRESFVMPKAGHQQLSQSEYFLKDGGYLDGDLDAVPKPDNYEKAKVKMERILSAYSSNRIDLDRFKVGHRNEDCLSDAYFVKASRGMAILFSYYSLLRLDFIGQSYDKFSYAHDEQGIEFKDMLMGMSSVQIIEYFGRYASKVRYNDREDIYLFLSELKAAHVRFAKQINEKIITSLNAEKRLDSGNFYDLGFSEHENECFANDWLTLYGVPSNYGYYLVDSWDFYLYSFWLRRYNDKTIRIVDQVLDFVLWFMKDLSRH